MDTNLSQPSHKHCAGTSLAGMEDWPGQQIAIQYVVSS